MFSIAQAMSLAPHNGYTYLFKDGQPVREFPIVVEDPSTFVRQEYDAMAAVFKLVAVKCGYVARMRGYAKLDDIFTDFLIRTHEALLSGVFDDQRGSLLRFLNSRAEFHLKEVFCSPRHRKSAWMMDSGEVPALSNVVFSSLDAKLSPESASTYGDMLSSAGRADMDSFWGVSKSDPSSDISVTACLKQAAPAYQHNDEERTSAVIRAVLSSFSKKHDVSEEVIQLIISRDMSVLQKDHGLSKAVVNRVHGKIVDACKKVLV